MLVYNNEFKCSQKNVNRIGGMLLFLIMINAAAILLLSMP